MVGLLLAIALFNAAAFLLCKRLTGNQILHIWSFTAAFQDTFDLYVDVKYHGYWYFTQHVDWVDLFAHSVLLPPINMMILNWYPFHKPLRYQALYLLLWDIGVGGYELATLLPRPWGYFSYGWWTIWYSLLINPILMMTLVSYFLLIRKLEKRRACDAR
ncbi:hypothetical protein I8J29_06225 [Paenibacillus sp. MWE-103]|uniref:EXPERA domain-containing protein n=1 Tax=Paenibacillus artemisiicola TaxID=1172618 RepID=A0ABS3W6H5_9BACL|nr:hypothetical protein [Paenibacillus artemisiicola]MBO7743786.1 hypothetical protein [Paenibacillus artemisiicola]